MVCSENRLKMAKPSEIWRRLAVDFNQFCGVGARKHRFLPQMWRPQKRFGPLPSGPGEHWKSYAGGPIHMAMWQTLNHDRPWPKKWLSNVSNDWYHPKWNSSGSGWVYHDYAYSMLSIHGWRIPVTEWVNHSILPASWKLVYIDLNWIHVRNMLINPIPTGFVLNLSVCLFPVINQS